MTANTPFHYTSEVYYYLVFRLNFILIVFELIDLIIFAFTGRGSIHSTFCRREPVCQYWQETLIHVATNKSQVILSIYIWSA